MDIRCTRCGKKNAVLGPGFIDEKEEIKVVEITVSENDYFQCPECGFGTHDKAAFSLERKRN